MILTHKMRIYPSSNDCKYIESVFGYARYCYNKGLATWQSLYKNNTKRINGKMIRNILKSDKQEWENKYCPSVLDSAIEDLEHAFNNFFNKNMKNHKQPKFKKKDNNKNSFRYYRKNDSSIRIKGNRLYMSKFKNGIKLSEKIRFEGVIKTCTISRKADKYFASFSIEVDDNNLPKLKKCKSVIEYAGIDLGIKTFAIVGYEVNNQRKYKSFKGKTKKLKKLYTKISYYQKRLSKKIKGSNNYNVMKTKLRRLYLRINNIENDYLHKLTNKLLKKFNVITIEDLNVSGMIKNKKLSKSIQKSLFRKFRTFLVYKSKIYNKRIIIADRMFPSTQTCSCCGFVKTKNLKLNLSNRIYVCNNCGFKEDRDNNASYNLKLYGERFELGCSS